MRPGAGIAAYWLGPTWNGTRARTSTATSQPNGRYTITYPHLTIDVLRPLGDAVGEEAITLANGTSGTMHVARPGADGAVSFSNGAGVVELAEEGEHGQHPGPVAFVFLPNATVTLAGSAVTQASAAAIARALRPL